MRRRILFFLLISVIGGIRVHAQDTQVLPDPVINFMQTRLTINPVFADPDKTIQFNSGYQSYFGIRKTRRLVYLSGTFSPHLKIGKTNNQNVGFSVNSQKVGSFISRNRFHFTYAYHLDFNKLTKLSAGAGLGMINFAIDDNPSGVVGSDVVLDANLGIKLQVKEYYLACILDPALNSVLRPARESYNVEQQFTLYLGGLYGLGPSFQLKSAIKYDVGNQIQGSLNFNFLVTWNDVIGLGLAYDFDRLVTTLLLDQLSWGNDNLLQVGLSYDMPVSVRSISGSNTYQIVLNLEKRR